MAKVGGRKSARKSTRKHRKSHKKSARKSHKKSARRTKKRSLRGKGMMSMLRRDPPCVSPGTKDKVWIPAFGQNGTYTGQLKVGDQYLGPSRNRKHTRVCMANGQGKWVSDDGKHTVEGEWKNDKFQGKIPNPTHWRDRAGNACPGPHCGQPQAPEFSYHP